MSINPAKMAVVLGVLFVMTQHVCGDERIRKQFVEYYTVKPVNDGAVTKLMSDLKPDGTWSDINYKSKRRSGWDMVAHLTRLRRMATAYANPQSTHHKQAGLKAKILKGLGHWLEQDYRNPNWFNAKIGVPKSMAPTFLLLGDDLPKPMLEQALKTVLNRTEISMTGQNRVWCAGIVLMRGVLTKNNEAIRKASDTIWEAVKVTPQEGLQADWSFHQHGPQLQVGNYGMSFAGTMTEWALILRGTPYALKGEKLAMLRNMMLESMAWYHWKGRWDLSACGRQVMPGCQASKARSVRSSMARMKILDSDYAERYAIETQPLQGFKGFWRSDTAVVRRLDWYASIRMQSTRTIGAETCNSENMHGLHLADGVLLHYQTGREYQDIQPVWDWRRLPGTTCDQGLTKLRPGGRGQSAFVGVLGDGHQGVAAMIYKRSKLSAHKAWFVFDDRIVCLGAGIRGESLGPVYTSVEQCWASAEGPVSADDAGPQAIKAGRWVHHEGVGYRMLCDATLTSQTVKGSWKKIFPTRPQGEASGKVFSLWIDHGKSPRKADYAYALFPSSSEKGADKPAARILSNTETMQAVALEGDLAAVFYAPGKIAHNGITLQVDKPCLMMLRKGQLFVSEPTQKQKSLVLSQGEKSMTVQLPSGVKAGSTAVVQ